MKVNIAILLLSSTLLMLSCKDNRKEMLTGAWHGVKIENPEMDTFFMKSQQYIDTIGKNNSDATNIALYGYSNVDSIRKALQVQHDSAQSMQMNAVINTVFDFKKDSMVVISFNGAMDTSKWHIESDSILVMEEVSGNGKGSNTKLQINSLKKDELKLQFEEENTHSIVTFNRVTK